MDDLEKARGLIRQQSRGLNLLRDLLMKATGKEAPLKIFRATLPKIISTSVSYTCGVGCEMCNAGFSDRTYLFPGYKYLQPKEFEQLSPWIKSASHVVLVGMGETLDSPYLYEFIKQLNGKISFITTSGVPLNREKTIRLIQSKLQYINFSFDGKTAVGHGAGNEKYIQKFWEKLKVFQETKRELSCNHPIAMMTLALDRENLEYLDDIFQTAYSHEIRIVDLIFMIPWNERLFEKSIFSNLNDSREKINKAIRKGNARGMHIRIFEEEQMQERTETCYFVDKHLIFNLNRNQPSICCGPITLPLETRNLSPETYWNSFPFRYFRYLHFSSDPTKLPLACQNCWIMDPQKYCESATTSFTRGENFQETLSLYRTASNLKRENRETEAEEMFSRILDITQNISLKGKVFFHLGELRIKNKNYPEALSYMKLTVRNCFDHQMAFTYLYLLLVLTGKTKEREKRRTLKSDHLNHFAEHSPYRPGKIDFSSLNPFLNVRCKCS
ncbi:MAG: hypothetical protein ACE5E9_03700 [Nitrospinaceae bacterium]